MKKKDKKIDILMLIFLLFLACLYAYTTKDLFIGKALFAGAAFTIPPVIYLGLRQTKNWRKVLTSTLLFGGLFGFIFEFIAEYTKAYAVISSVFPFKILGVLPPDNVLGHMMMTCLTVVFYEHFVDREKNHHISRHIIYAILPAFLVLDILIFIFYFQPSLLITKFPYFFMGIGAIIPPIFLAYKKPRFIRNMLETAVYFFFLYFIIELFAVAFNYWIYPGNNYIGWVTIMNFSFPFEELFFWMLFYAASLVSYYELFIDDH